MVAMEIMVGLERNKYLSYTIPVNDSKATISDYRI